MLCGSLEHVFLYPCLLIMSLQFAKADHIILVLYLQSIIITNVDNFVKLIVYSLHYDIGMWKHACMGRNVKLLYAYLHQRWEEKSVCIWYQFSVLNLFASVIYSFD